MVVKAATGHTFAAGPAVAIVVYDGVTPFEFAVACDVFGRSRPELGVDWYRFSICAATPGPVRTETGFAIDVRSGLRSLEGAHTVIVPPTNAPGGVVVEVLEALQRAHRRGARLVSFCTGAFVLAEAGLLDGRRVTTHWAECDELARRYPTVTVDPNVLYVDDEDVLTSAGSAASIDLSLHVVRSDYGSGVATQLARDLVVPPHRDGGQAQYIEAPIPDLEEMNLFASSFAWLEEHLAEPITVEDLAARAAMSPRTFARRFRATTGATPYQWLLRQRLALAQRLLETSDTPIELVASASGFGTATNLRKHFQRVLCTGPQAYRRTFRQERAS
jgi:AraC family transcriptional activator FtrA